MFRTLISVFFIYFIYKIARVLIDPLFEPSDRVNATAPKNEAKPESPKAGDYIDYEEIK